MTAMKIEEKDLGLGKGLFATFDTTEGTFVIQDRKSVV